MVGKGGDATATEVSRSSFVEQDGALLVEANVLLRGSLRNPGREPEVLLLEGPDRIGEDPKRDVDAQGPPRDHVSRDPGRKARATRRDLENLVGMKSGKYDERRD